MKNKKRLDILIPYLCGLPYAHIFLVCKAHNIPIIGQGGVVCAQDALEFIIAGASAVGVGTGLFYDPLLCPKINAGIVDYLERHSLSSITPLIGSLQIHEHVSTVYSG